jgi:hypothetical protein
MQVHIEYRQSNATTLFQHACTVCMQPVMHSTWEIAPVVTASSEACPAFAPRVTTQWAPYLSKVSVKNRFGGALQRTRREMVWGLHEAFREK